MCAASALPPIGSPSTTMSRCPMGKTPAVDPTTKRNYACLPGGAINQCPTGSKCWYTGIDYLCCPMEEDDDQFISTPPIVRLPPPATIGRSLPPPTVTESPQSVSSEQPTRIELPQRRRGLNQVGGLSGWIKTRYEQTSPIDPSIVHTANVRSVPTANNLTQLSVIPVDDHMASMFDQLQHGYPYDDAFYYPSEYMHRYDEETRQYLNAATTPQVGYRTYT